MFPLRLSGDFERPRWKPEETVSRDLAATAAGLEVLCHIQGEWVQRNPADMHWVQ